MRFYGNASVQKKGHREHKAGTKITKTYALYIFVFLGVFVVLRVLCDQ
jgi:hypothetical protein